MGALSGQDLAWPRLADNPAHCSPVKLALSEAKYVHSMLLGGRKWMGKRGEQAYWQLEREEEKGTKKLQIPCLNNAADKEEADKRLACRRMMMERKSTRI